MFTNDDLSIRKKLHGFTFLELILSITLATLVSYLLFKTYFSIRQHFNSQYDLLLLQDNLQTAREIIIRDLKNSGLIGCARLTDDFPLFSEKKEIFNAKNKLSIQHNAITVRYGDFTGVSLLKATEGDLLMTSKNNYKPYDILIISDCVHAEIFTVKDVYSVNNKTIIKPFSALHYAFEAKTEIGELISHHYFTNKTKRLDSYQQPIYALYQEDIHGKKIELLEYLNDMKFSANKTEIEIDLYAKVNRLQKNLHAYVDIMS